MSEAQDGVGWVYPSHIWNAPNAEMPFAADTVEVAFGTELARLRKCENAIKAIAGHMRDAGKECDGDPCVVEKQVDSLVWELMEKKGAENLGAKYREDAARLARWLKSNKRSNEIINEVFGEDKYAMPTTPEEFDAYMQMIDAATEEEK